MWFKKNEVRILWIYCWKNEDDKYAYIKKLQK
jgi:hypothetical protein